MKTLILVVLLIAIASSAFAFPTYTSNTHTYLGGYYGNSTIMCVLEDETGKQLFDGEYGGYDWMADPGGMIASNEDYWARYDQENGYGYAWVFWYGDVATPTITFDMGSSYLFSSIGLHGYENPTGAAAYLPDVLTVSFSDDGVNFANTSSQVFSEVPVPDTVNWREISFSPTQARYAQISFENAVQTYRIDEMSINGMDGAQFPVPEPSSLLALVGGLSTLGFLRRRKGR